MKDELACTTVTLRHQREEAAVCPYLPSRSYSREKVECHNQTYLQEFTHLRRDVEEPYSSHIKCVA